MVLPGRKPAVGIPSSRLYVKVYLDLSHYLKGQEKKELSFLNKWKMLPDSSVAAILEVLPRHILCFALFPPLPAVLLIYPQGNCVAGRCDFI